MKQLYRRSKFVVYYRTLALESTVGMWQVWCLPRRWGCRVVKMSNLLYNDRVHFFLFRVNRISRWINSGPNYNDKTGSHF